MPRQRKPEFQFPPEQLAVWRAMPQGSVAPWRARLNAV
jgi:hypothetical protein